MAVLRALLSLATLSACLASPLHAASPFGPHTPPHDVFNLASKPRFTPKLPVGKRALVDTTPEANDVVDIDLLSACNRKPPFSVAGFNCTITPPKSVGVPGTTVRYWFQVGDNNLNVDMRVKVIDGALNAYLASKRDASAQFLPMSDSIDVGGDDVLMLVKGQYYPNYIYAIAIEFVGTTTALFSLDVATFNDPPHLDPADLSVLLGIGQKCCKTPCTGDFGQFMASKAELCSLPSMHCDAQTSKVTYLSLGYSGLSCSITDLADVAKLSGLIFISISGNSITGDIGTFFGYLEGLTSLAHVYANQLGGLTGQLPPDCVAPIDKLESLALANTAVSGSLQPCLFSNNLNYLDIHNNNMAGTIPSLPIGSVLRVFVASRDDPYTKLTGPAPDLSNARDLSIVSLDRNALTGTLTLNEELQYVSITNNGIDGLAFDGPTFPSVGVAALQVNYIYIDGNAMSGTVPDFIASAPELLVLSASGNKFTALPPTWRTVSLQYLTLSGNQIGGPVPPWLAMQDSLLWADLSNNSLSGTLQDFAAAAASNADKVDKLLMLFLQNNAIAGSLDSAPLTALGVFASNSYLSYVENGTNVVLPHVLNLANNTLNGTIPDVLIEDLVVQLERGVNMHVELRGNKLECADNVAARVSKDELFLLGCMSADEAKQYQGGGGGGGGGASNGVAVGIAFACIIGVAALLGGLFVLLKRRRDTGSFRAAASGLFSLGRGGQASHFNPRPNSSVPETELV